MKEFMMLTVLIFVLGVVSGERVPVMLWSNDDTVTFPDALAGHTLNSAQFDDQYIVPNLGENKNLIVFVQNKLSIADISHYANVYGFDEQDATFPNVKALMMNEESANLPNVLSPVSVFERKGRDVRILESPYNIANLVHSSEGSTGLGIVLVKLPDVDTANHQSSLKANDEIIGAVVKQLEQHDIKYTAVYTAVTSNKKLSAEQLGVRSGRQLLADSSSSGAGNASNHWLVDDQILLYLGGLAISNSSSVKWDKVSWLDLNQLVDVQEESHCYNGTIDDRNTSDCFIVLRYQPEEPVKNLSLKFSFMQSGKGDAGYWYISNLDISYINTTDDEEVRSLSLDVSNIGIALQSPTGFSMSCYQPDPIGPMNKTRAAAYLYMKQFQVQAFGYFKNGGFGYHNDCQYFFGAGIWMALISLAVMIGILLFGLYMLFQITTMDRFDDPKGKTLIIAAAAD